MIVHTDICILGGGPTALLLASLLKKERINFLLVSEKLEGALIRLEKNNHIFNPIPIFPVTDSYLYNKLGLKELFVHNESLRREYSELVDDNLFQSCMPSSVGTKLYHIYGNQSLILSRKQFGEIVMTKPLQRLQEKVSRHYPSNGQSLFRLGFMNGVSPYLTYIDSQAPFPLVNGGITLINIKEHKVFVDKIEIRYKYLISTIPLPELMTQANIKEKLLFVSTGAQFYVFETEANLNANRLIYDCDVNSCVYRVFIPHENFVSVHLARDNWNEKVPTVSTRVQELLHSDVSFNFLNSITLKNCYPLDAYPISKYEEMTSLLKTKGVYLFGRLSQWDYLDLHELDWELIDELVTRINAI